MTKSRDLGDLAQTVAASLPTSLGSAGQAIVVNTGANGLEFGDAGSSVTVVENVTGLGNITSPSAGDMALVTDLNNIYVRKTAGWYLIATVTNQGPQSVSVTLSGGGGGDSSAYTLASDGSTTSTVTGSADPDREADTLSWSASAGTSTAFAATLTDGGSAVNITTSADTSTVLATISQSSNVFTITPSSSTTAPNGGTFSVTFAVTDGINTSVDNTTTFTLDFPPNYSGSPSSTAITSYSWASGEKLGFAIALDTDGDTIVVGSTEADYNASTAPNSGEAYVYERTGTNSWSQVKNITPSDANAAFDTFACDLDISGDGNYIVAGMSNDDDTQTNSGAIYVWYKGTGSWSGGTQQAKKKASVVENGANFGFSVAIDSDGDTIVAGAPYENVYYTNGMRGACYVFTRSGTTWSQQARLIASDYGSYGFHQFGTGCTISGDGNTIAIAARDGMDGSGNTIGAVHVFTRSGSTWTEQKKLLPSGTQTITKFGFEGAIKISSDGNYIIVGAQWYDVGSNSNEGTAWIFYKGATSWASTGALQARIEQSNGYAQDGFGIDVGISDDGSMAVVGAEQHDYPNGSQQGACYVFTRAGTSWSQQAKLYNNSGDLCGSSVAISGDNAYVAAGLPNYNANRGGFKVWKG
jgi:hypothetical protein